MRERLTVAGEVWRGHILDGDLLQEGWFLTARVPTDHPGLLQPLTQPRQVTVAHIRVGQEVTVKITRDRDRERNRVNASKTKVTDASTGSFLNMLLHNRTVHTVHVSSI